MAEEVYWMLELNVQAGQEEAVPELVGEMVGSTRENEPGALDYKYSFSADGKACHIFERYADSDAALAHLATFGQRFAGRFLEVFAPTRFVVYGSPNGQVKDALAAFNPTYMDPGPGFRR